MLNIYLLSTTSKWLSERNQLTTLQQIVENVKMHIFFLIHYNTDQQDK